MKLIAVGDNVTDCYLDEGIYYPGGNAVNVAVDCKRDGAEKVNYIGVFGNDDRADYIRACMEEEGVTCERSRKVFAPTCQPGVKINEEGDRIFVGGIRDTCQHLFSIRLQREDLEVIKEYDGTKIIGITRGSKGSVFYDGTEFYTQGICKVDVVDAMGAGDAFIAAFLRHYADNKDMKEALSYAAERAAYACTYAGGFGHPHKA